MLATGTSGGHATLNAAGAARLGTLATTAGDIGITAVSGVTGASPAARADLTAGGSGSDIAIAAGALARLDTVTAHDSVTLGAASIDAVTVTATDGALAATGGRVTIGAGTAGTTLALTATEGNVSLGSGTAGGDALIAAGDAARVGSLGTVDGDIGIRATGG